ncbi:ion transporter [Aliidiomarina maris]|uniref:Cation transporter n=1 Tax=Aliidiomarina maris TaxID=531312 RepID=A0A327WYP5_9GAMM|nr:ion transporter [Aliidiomarina maris]RAJ96978.1 voltage-gated sodium channel [Aliidiomarina maris]RUO24589.1 cation transporter [Aliidiomarina maris]
MNKQSLYRLQQGFLRLRSNKIFETIVIIIIVFSALMVGAKTYEETNRFTPILNVLDWAVTLFFLVEIIIRLLAERRWRDFFKSGWNVFDFIIVVASLIPVENSETVLIARLLRVFRVMRLVSMVPELRMLMNALLKALPKMGYVALFMFIIFYIYGAIGSFIFRDINPFYWDNISIAVLTLFRISTFESWTAIMYETMEVYPWSWVYYVSFIFFSAFIFLNMMIGIVLETMQKESAAHEVEQGEGEAADLKALRQGMQDMQAQMKRMEQLLNQPRSTDKDSG